MTGLDLTIGIGTTLQVFKVGDLLLTLDQKKRLQSTVETFTLRLAYLEPVQWLRNLNTKPGHVAVTFAAASELAFREVIGRHYWAALILLFLGVFIVLLALAIPFCGRTLDRVLNYFLEPLLPCFNGLPGHLRPAMKELERRANYIGGISILLIVASLLSITAIPHLSLFTIFLFLPIGISCLFSAILFLPIAHTVAILQITLAITFTFELLVKLARAIAWRIVESTGGASGAIFMLLTATVTICAIILRIKV